MSRFLPVFVMTLTLLVGFGDLPAPATYDHAMLREYFGKSQKQVEDAFGKPSFVTHAAKSPPEDAIAEELKKFKKHMARRPVQEDLLAGSRREQVVRGKLHKRIVHGVVKQPYVVDECIVIPTTCYVYLVEPDNQVKVFAPGKADQWQSFAEPRGVYGIYDYHVDSVRKEDESWKLSYKLKSGLCGGQPPVINFVTKDNWQSFQVETEEPALENMRLIAHGMKAFENLYQLLPYGGLHRVPWVAPRLVLDFASLTGTPAWALTLG